MSQIFIVLRPGSFSPEQEGLSVLHSSIIIVLLRFPFTLSLCLSPKRAFFWKERKEDSRYKDSTSCCCLVLWQKGPISSLFLSVFVVVWWGRAERRYEGTPQTTSASAVWANVFARFGCSLISSEYEYVLQKTLVFLSDIQEIGLGKHRKKLSMFIFAYISLFISIQGLWCALRALQRSFILCTRRRKLYPAIGNQSEMEFPRLTLTPASRRKRKKNLPKKNSLVEVLHRTRT